MYYYVPTTLENIQVSTGAQDIAVGTGGVFINMVTKSGSNRFTGMALQTYQSKATQSTTSATSFGRPGFRPDANSTELLDNTNVQVGGPLLQQQALLLRRRSISRRRTSSVPGFPAVRAVVHRQSPLVDTSDQDTTDILAGEGKAIVSAQRQATASKASSSKQRYDKPNRGRLRDHDAGFDSKELDTFVVAQLSYNTVLSDRMFLDSKVSYNNTHFPLLQKTDLQPLTDSSTTDAVPEPGQQPDHVPAPGAGRVELASISCRTSSAAATSSRPDSTTATRPRTSIRCASTTST